MVQNHALNVHSHMHLYVHVWRLPPFTALVGGILKAETFTKVKTPHIWMGNDLLWCTFH